jgi:hypothetical protein
MIKLTALALLIVTRRSRRDQLLSVLVKIGLFALLLQPFVHLAGDRYWTTAAPLATLAVLLAVRVVGGFALDRFRRRATDGAPSRLLTLVQAGLAALGVAAVVAINLLAN